mgnify:CR=1 FL=1
MRILFLFALLLLFGCASSGISDRAGLRELIKVGNYQGAIDYIQDNSFFNNEKNKYLKNLELGMAYHLKGVPSMAVNYLSVAKEIDDSLFTVSISNQLKTAMTNDLSKRYQGDIYERSAMYFYLALNRAILATKETAIFADAGSETGFSSRKLSRDERQSYLYAARATVVSWDSFMENVRRDAKKEVFQHDLLAKLGGGFIHEMIGTRNDRQTAIYLYEQALQILPSFYAPYESINKLNKEFKKAFFRGKKDRSFIALTDEAKSLRDFIKMKIRHLKKIRDKKHNLMIVWEEGLIGEKKPKREYYSIARALAGPDSTPEQKRAARLGAGLITLFAASSLGLLPPPNRYSPVGMEFGVRLGLAAGSELAISFDVPVIEKVDPLFPAEISFHAKDGSEVLRTPLHIANPISEVAEASTAFHSAKRAITLGARLAWKHILAITASMATYKSMKKNNAEFIAKQVAVFQYMAAAKLIAESEAADTRYWSTLPKNIRLTHVYLPAGTYQVKIHENVSMGGTSSFGPIVIRENQKNVFNIRL